MLSVYAVLGQPMYLKIKFPVKTSIETFRGVHLGAINTMSINYNTCVSVSSWSQFLYTSPAKILLL